MILILSGKAKQSIALYRGYDMSVSSEKLGICTRSADIMKHTAQLTSLQQEYLGKCKLIVFPLETTASCL